MRSTFVLVGVAAVSLGVALLVPRSEAQYDPQESPGVQAWEYKVVDIESLIEIRGLGRENREKMAAELEKSLNRLGDEGWEFSFELRGPMVFKRPK